MISQGAPSPGSARLFIGSRGVACDVPVLGLREGAWLRADGVATVLHGRDAVLFRRGREAEEIAADTDFVPIMAGPPARFDA